MAWPTDNISTTHLDAGTDDPSQARVDLLNTAQAVKDIIAARGAVSGVADLDSSGDVPAARLGLAVLKAGSTMTGDLTVNKADPIISSRASSGTARIYLSKSDGNRRCAFVSDEATKTASMILYADDAGTVVAQIKLDQSGVITVTGSIFNEAWIAPTFNNSWVNFGAGDEAGYFKSADGIVFIRGLIKSGTMGAPAFFLPAGYRPEKRLVLPAYSNDALGRLDINTNGSVVPGGVTSLGSNVSFGIYASFRAV